MRFIKKKALSKEERAQFILSDDYIKANEAIATITAMLKNVERSTNRLVGYVESTKIKPNAVGELSKSLNAASYWLKIVQQEYTKAIGLNPFGEETMEARRKDVAVAVEEILVDSFFIGARDRGEYMLGLERKGEIELTAKVREKLGREIEECKLPENRNPLDVDEYIKGKVYETETGVKPKRKAAFINEKCGTCVFRSAFSNTSRKFVCKRYAILLKSDRKIANCSAYKDYRDTMVKLNN